MLSQKEKIMLSTRKRYRIDRKSVGWLKFIFEAYDGIALISTKDPYAAEVEFQIPPGCEADVDDLIRDLGRDMIIEPVNSNS